MPPGIARSINYWLKIFGMGEGRVPDPMPLPDDWKTRQKGLITKRAYFAERPGIHAGDKIVYYAARHRKIIAEGGVKSDPYHDASTKPWVWHVDVQLDLLVDKVSDGAEADALSVAGRNLLRLVARRRNGLLRLMPKEYAAAVTALQKATKAQPTVVESPSS